MIDKFNIIYRKMISEQVETAEPAEQAGNSGDEFAQIKARLVGKSVTKRSLSITPGLTYEPGKRSPVTKYDVTTTIKGIQVFPRKNGSASYKVRFANGISKDCSSLDELKYYADELGSKPSLNGRFYDDNGEWYASYAVDMVNAKGWDIEQVFTENVPSWSEFADKAKEFVNEFLQKKQSKIDEMQKALDEETSKLNSILGSLD